MRKTLFLIALTFFFSIGNPPLWAKDAKSADFDLNGTWKFQTSDHKSYGVCDKGKNYSGTLVISQKGDKVKLVFQSGPIVCDPPAACAYQGKIKEDEVYFHSSSVAPDEGGTILKSIHLKLNSATSASGQSREIKQFIGGNMCEWTNKILLTK